GLHRVDLGAHRLEVDRDPLELDRRAGDLGAETGLRLGKLGDAVLLGRDLLLERRLLRLRVRQVVAFRDLRAGRSEQPREEGDEEDEEKESTGWSMRAAATPRV